MFKEEITKKKEEKTRKRELKKEEDIGLGNKGRDREGSCRVRARATPFTPSPEGAAESLSIFHRRASVHQV